MRCIFVTLQKIENDNKKERMKDAEKALEEQDAKWEAVHGISRHEHQRFLLAPYVDFESNAEYARFMVIEQERKAKKMEGEE